MIDAYWTEVMLTPGEAESVIEMFHEFSEACRAGGIWIQAKAKKEESPDREGRVPVRAAMVIDDSLRCKPGSRMKPLSLTDEDIDEMMESGMSVDEIADRAGVSRATLYRRLAARRKGNVTHIYRKE